MTSQPQSCIFYAMPSGMMCNPFSSCEEGDSVSALRGKRQMPACDLQANGLMLKVDHFTQMLIIITYCIDAQQYPCFEQSGLTNPS